MRRDISSTHAKSSQSDAPFVSGVGINATDTIIRLPEFPSPDSKLELLSAQVSPGGQVASALVACRRWGLSARYTGKIGDDAAGKLQMGEMEREGVDAHWIIAERCSSQIAYILVDDRNGERTVLWKRDAKIALRPEEIPAERIRGARALLVDGHDTTAATHAAQIARAEGIPVVGDFDNRYAGVEALLEYVDFAISSKDFPMRLTGEHNLLKSLPAIQSRFKCRLMAATLGRLGAIVWNAERFMLCPGFRIRAVDTTGAGDIFHGAFLYGVAHGWKLQETLEFSCAAAALNCEAAGARGGIASLENIAALRARNERSELAFSQEELERAARQARGTMQGDRG
ncbi:MAG TPA: PfkB family carbohydrate kinase [Candidatus Acidoferrales bacterium]|nr:PfkB family carbohydrate kinase [Candidatus Acidoferrales bacterium]